MTTCDLSGASPSGDFGSLESPQAREACLHSIGVRARRASVDIARLADGHRSGGIRSAAAMIAENSEAILNANQADLDGAGKRGRPSAFLERLALDQDRIHALCDGMRGIADLPDPVGKRLASWSRPNGLVIERISVPLGVLGIIYESRPNVAADAAALSLKSGNAVVLRSGSDGLMTAMAISDAIGSGYREMGIPDFAQQVVPFRDRMAVSYLLSGMDGAIDVVVPRGGKSLVERVSKEARVPVFAHLEGICHVYVHQSSGVRMASEVSVNAKMRRVGICGAAETLLIDEAALGSHLEVIVRALIEAGCEIRACSKCQEVLSTTGLDIRRANEVDWTTEYLDAVISIRAVSGVEVAISHIRNYGSSHTDAILCEDDDVRDVFFEGVDSAIVVHNASTQFADGGEFGFGAELGIATGRFHARGPIGAEQLTCFSYRVKGEGQVRPA